MKDIVIVGGGTAGWMTAATMVKAYPKSNITVYEDASTPGLGVGESTTQFFRKWLYYIGLEDEQWMAECDATYKISVRFHDFHKKGDKPWQYPFGAPRKDTYPPDMWFYKQWKDNWPSDGLARDYYLAAECGDRNRLPVIDNEYYNVRYNSGFHFNAVKFANWLKDNYCIPKGVVHKQKKINKKKLPKHDIIFDCTGFKSLLNDSPWKSFEDYLPNNSAWVTRVHYDDKQTQITPVTDCTALSRGWVWNVPTYDSIGTGYVFCDKFISPENARKEFREYLTNNVQSDCGVYSDKMFRKIKFRTGRKEEVWKGNVVSIGLSAGFIEPLESNGLLSIHNFLLYLLRVLEDRPVHTQYMRDTFNNHCNYTFDAFASFVAMHYSLTQRDDSPYWKHVSQVRYPNEHMIQTAQLNFLEESSNFGQKYQWHPLYEGLWCIMAGHNWQPFNSVIESEIDFFGPTAPMLTDLERPVWNIDIDNMPTPYEYYQRTLYAN